MEVVNKFLFREKTPTEKIMNLMESIPKRVEIYSGQVYTWQADWRNYLFPYLLKISTVCRDALLEGFYEAKTYLLKHKEYVMGGAAILIALLVFARYRKNRSVNAIQKQSDLSSTPASNLNLQPSLVSSVSSTSEKLPQHLLKAKMKTSMHVAELTIKAPPVEKSKKSFTMTFCVDNSGSMKGERLEAVKKEVCKVFESAQQKIADKPLINITFAVTVFNNRSSTLIRPTSLDPHNNEVKNSMTKQIESLSADGGTDLINGLEGATNHLEEMMNNNPSGSHLLIMLTDGDSTLPQESLNSIKKRFSSIECKVIIGGIGKEHKAEKLKQIADITKGEYVSLAGGKEIEEAITNAYSQTVAAFSDLKLITSQLKANTWSVKQKFTTTVIEEGISQVALGSLNEKQKIKQRLELHLNNFNTDFDLSTLHFQLRYRDPNDVYLEIDLPWDHHSIIKPAIIRS